MNVILFGASGMVGAGVLRECLEDPQVKTVLSVGRRASGVSNPKLRELLLPELTALDAADAELDGFDACFFCLGVSAAGMTEAAYRQVTLDLTLRTAETLLACNPGLTFCYVSGQGTDSSGVGRIMWARVKGETENRLLDMPLSAYMFRPGYIQPLKGARSRTRVYQLFYTVLGPLFPILNRLFPNQVTTTVNVGRAMIRVAASGSEKRILGPKDINRLAAAG
jgi:uncharacterized protein YbjT (DUF2867 family)